MIRIPIGTTGCLKRFIGEPMITKEVDGILTGIVQRIECDSAENRLCVSFPALDDLEKWVTLGQNDSPLPRPGEKVMCIIQGDEILPLAPPRPSLDDPAQGSLTTGTFSLPMGLTLEIDPQTESFELKLPDRGNIRWTSRSGTISIGAAGNVQILSQEGDIRLDAPKGSIRIAASDNIQTASGQMTMLHSRSHATLQSTQGKVHVVSEKGMNIVARGDDLHIDGGPYIRLNEGK